MNDPRTQQGFTVVELMISLAILSVLVVSTAVMLVENSRINKTQQMRVAVQSSARTTLALVVQKLRIAGWDPTDTGIAPVALDSDLSDAVSYIDLFADLNADGDTGDTGETTTIRHVGDRVEWRETSAASFEIVSTYVTNDADGDGTPEPMFIPDSTASPTRITVRVTASSRHNDPGTGEPVRFTIQSDVFLRNAG